MILKDNLIYWLSKGVPILNEYLWSISVGMHSSKIIEFSAVAFLLPLCLPSVDIL